jgi:large subunit ribosomal protein L3
MFHGESGEAVAVTVIQASPNVAHQVKTEERDGYRAVQMGFGAVAAKSLNRARSGHFKKLGTAPTRVVKEIALDSPDEQVAPGQTFGVEVFENVRFVDVTGVSKGRGFTGTPKRHNFHLGRASHGNTNYREPGSVGANTFPARIFPGKRMAGQYGARQVTKKRLELMGVDKDLGLVFVRGAIPGATNGMVVIQKTTHKQ